MAAMLSFLLAAGAMPFAPMAEMFETVTVFAEDVNAPVTYIDKDGAEQTLTDYMTVTAEATDWTDAGYYGWLVVKDDVTINGFRDIGDSILNLIICDGKTLTVTNDGGYPSAIYGINGTLSIYSQSGGTGTLKVKTTGNTESGIELSHLYFYGGKLEVDSTSLGKDGDGDYVNKYPAIFGGVHLSWNSPTDRIILKHTPTEGGTVSLVEDEVPEFIKSYIIDGTNTLADSAKTTDDFTALCSGKTLVPAYKITFDMNCDELENIEMGVLADGTQKAKSPENPVRQWGYTFLGWYESKDGEGEAFDFSKPVTKDTTLYAKWHRDETERNIVIDKNIKNGTVTADKEKAASTDIVTLTATPDVGYTVKSVKYNDTEIAPQNGVYSFKMPAEEVTVTAEFELKDYSITIDPDIWGGTLTVDKTTAHMGETVTVTAVPNDDPHYDIKTKNVKYNGIEIPNNNGYSFIMPAENVEITGRFTANGNSGDIIWEYDHDTKTITFTGNGAIIDYDPEYASPWSYLKDDITAVKIEQGITKIGTYAFNDCYNVTQAELPDSLEEIRYAAFNGCKHLETINLPNGINRISSGAFMFCESLKEVILPNGISYLSEFLFQGCTSLETVTIPKGVTSIHSYEFWDCTSVSDIYCYADPTKLTWWKADISYLKPEKATKVHVSPDMLSTYQEKFGNINATFVGDLPYGKCGDNAWWEYDEATQTLTISGKGALWDTAWGVESKWGEYGSDIKTVKIKSGITSIGEYNFKTHIITSIELPNTLENIGPNAFYECKKLKTINIPSGIKTIGVNAFRECISLQHIEIPEGVTDIAINTFNNCTSLKTVTIPSTVTNIAYNAFSFANNISNIYLYADPSKLEWPADKLSSDYYFRPNKGTICYVPEEYLEAYERDFSKVNVTFKGYSPNKEEISYINENGEEAVIDAYKLSANDTKLDKGAYFVDKDTEITHSIEFSADTKLILCDGTKLNITLNDNSANALKAASLAVYGQKEQTGKLQITLNNTDTTAIMVNGIYCDEYKQYGGNVTANVNAEIANSDAVCATGKGGIEICGGALNADSQKADGISAFNYSVVVSGGNVTADSIYAAQKITLSLENAKDSIFAEEYKAEAISIADERILKADNEFFAGKVDKTELSGKTLAKYDYVKGDTDLDGTLEDEDAALLLKYINGTAALSNANLVAAGVQNKEADILDVIAVLKLHQAD
ncbi:MAG: leucine-rich repeat protein [Firmicutes bacterium]|nr:leucine-rich repeat protein [Bacillota bacterium]